MQSPRQNLREWEKVGKLSRSARFDVTGAYALGYGGAAERRTHRAGDGGVLSARHWPAVSRWDAIQRLEGQSQCCRESLACVALQSLACACGRISPTRRLLST